MTHGALMLMTMLRGVIAGLVVIGVTEFSVRFPRIGALLLTLPIVSILACILSWHQYHDLPAISKLAKETIVLVLLGLPFFIPLAFTAPLGLGFWTSFGLDYYWRRRPSVPGLSLDRAYNALRSH